MVAEGNTNDPKEGNAEEDEQPANTYIIRPNYQNKWVSCYHYLPELMSKINIGIDKTRSVYWIPQLQILDLDLR